MVESIIGLYGLLCDCWGHEHITRDPKPRYTAGWSAACWHLNNIVNSTLF